MNIKKSLSCHQRNSFNDLKSSSLNIFLAASDEFLDKSWINVNLFIPSKQRKTPWQEFCYQPELLQKPWLHQLVNYVTYKPMIPNFELGSFFLNIPLSHPIPDWCKLFIAHLPLFPFWCQEKNTLAKTSQEQQLLHSVPGWVWSLAHIFTMATKASPSSWKWWDLQGFPQLLMLNKRLTFKNMGC